MNAVLQDTTGVRFERAGRRVMGFESDPPDRLRELSACPTLPAPAPELLEKVRAAYAYSFPIAPGCTIPREEIDRRIDEEYWGSPFEFGGKRVPNKIGGGPFAYEFGRYMHMFPALLSKTGGSLEGRSVLDVASHVGFWSVQARAHGAERVVGVEAAQRSVDVARFVLEITGLDRISYDRLNAYDLSPENPGVFDVVLYPGLLYHLDKPVTALEKLAAVTRQIALVDTQVVPNVWPVCVLGPEVEHGEGAAFHSNRLKMLPSRGAVVMMLRHVGFREIFSVAPEPSTAPPAYREGRRETFLALK